MLRSVEHCAGRTLAFPVLAAPMAELALLHPDGEQAVASALAAKGAGMVRPADEICCKALKHVV